MPKSKSLRGHMGDQPTLHLQYTVIQHCIGGRLKWNPSDQDGHEREGEERYRGRGKEKNKKTACLIRQKPRSTILMPERTLGPEHSAFRSRHCILWTGTKQLNWHVFHFNGGCSSTYMVITSPDASEELEQGTPYRPRTVASQHLMRYQRTSMQRCPGTVHLCNSATLRKSGLVHQPAMSAPQMIYSGRRSVTDASQAFNAKGKTARSEERLETAAVPLWLAADPHTNTH